MITQGRCWSLNENEGKVMEGRADTNLSNLIVNGKHRADEHEDRSERPYQEKYVLPARFIHTLLYAFVR